MSVQIEFTAGSKCVFAVIHAMQKRGLYLTVDEFESERTAGGDMFKVTLSASALVVKPNGSLVKPDDDDF